MRGIFGDIIKTNELYKNSSKIWIIELLRYDLVLLNQLRETRESILPKKMIQDHLNSIKKSLEDNLEKRFIYFLCSQKKIRFFQGKQPTFAKLSNKLKLFFTVGKNQKCITKYLPKKIFYDDEGNLPLISTDINYITFFYKKTGHAITYPVHDFVNHFNISFSTNLNVHYVGYTKNPAFRFTSARHDGLLDMLSSVSNEENDFFVLFNLFKVYAKTNNSLSLIEFTVANAMIDEVNVDKEGSIIEKAFIMYFNSPIQYRNRTNEYAELKNSLIELSSDFNIESIQIIYEIEGNEEWKKLYSDFVPAQHCHEFFISIKDGDIFLARDFNMLKAN